MVEKLVKVWLLFFPRCFPMGNQVLPQTWPRFGFAEVKFHRRLFRIEQTVNFGDHLLVLYRWYCYIDHRTTVDYFNLVNVDNTLLYMAYTLEQVFFCFSTWFCEAALGRVGMALACACRLRCPGESCHGTQLPHPTQGPGLHWPLLSRILWCCAASEPLSCLSFKGAGSGDPAICAHHGGRGACTGCEHEAGTSGLIWEIMSNADQISYCGGVTTLIRDQNRLH